MVLFYSSKLLTKSNSLKRSPIPLWTNHSTTRILGSSCSVSVLSLVSLSVLFWSFTSPATSDPSMVLSSENVSSGLEILILTALTSTFRRGWTVGSLWLTRGVREVFVLAVGRRLVVSSSSWVGSDLKVIRLDRLFWKCQFIFCKLL